MFSLDRFIEDCRTALKDSSPAAAVKAVVERAMRDPAAVALALDGDGPNGETNLTSRLYEATDLTILKVTWQPRLTVHPHDHRMWAVIGVYRGREENGFYRRQPVGLTRAGGRALGEKDTALLGADAIHDVTNPLNQFSSAIHVYGGDFTHAVRSMWEGVDGAEQPYDAARIRIKTDPAG